MSAENVEVMRVALEAWNAGDFGTLRDLVDSQALLRMPDGWPEPGPFVGREAVLGQWEQLREAWNADVLEPVGDFIDVGDRVVVSLIWRGTGHGPDMNMNVTAVYTLRNGRISGFELFWDRAEALEAAGLRE